MVRKPTPQPLILADGNPLDDPPQLSAEGASQAAASPVDSKSPKSQRTSPFPISKFAVHRNRPPRTGSSPTLQPQPPRPATSTGPPDEATRQQQQLQLQQYRTQARDDSDLLQPSMSTLNPPSAGLPPHSLRQAITDANKPTKPSFFQFNKAPKAANQPHTAQVQQHPESRSQPVSRGGEGSEKSGRKDPTTTEEGQQRSIPSHPSRSDLSVSSSGEAEATPPLPSIKKNKTKSFALLGRSKSVRDKESSRLKLAVAPVPLPTPNNPPIAENITSATTASANTPTTAALSTSQTPTQPQDRALRDDGMNSNHRNRPEDRTAGAAKDAAREKEHREHKEHKEHKGHSLSMRETGASTFLSGLRFSSTRAADLISKGLFGKSTRSGSTTEKEPVVDDEHYVLKVINLPLVEQTRLTRISKRLEDSRDKTEFWMPAFPWRAIDYLNYKGTEVEGLYRVPGSGPQVKKWQRRFDEQYDVNLFEQNDLYDINIVGSMLKAWLRELPDELFPKEAQERIARECQGAEKVPQLLIDELSNLSPFNYYLLFAITCHLSLLLAHSDKNKMDFRNLCICFQPCMKIDAFCFKFLVCDWRDCWRGCKNEPKYIEVEYQMFDQPPPRGLADMQAPLQSEAKEDVNPVSLHANVPSIEEPSEQAMTMSEQPTKLNKPEILFSKSSNSLSSHRSSISTALSADSEVDENATDMFGFTHTPQVTGTRELRPLSPIQPLSPLGF